MKVILLQHIRNIGQKGDVKDVSEGYFRNFLAPQKLAITADDKQLAHIQSQKSKQNEKLEAMKESAMSVKEKINDKTITIEEKASESGKLFAALSKKEICSAIERELKVTIAEKQFELSEQIKSLGEFTIEIPLYKDISAKLRINVKAK